MPSLSNPHESHTFKWWIREGAIAEEDGHPIAAAGAYAQALELAADEWETQLAKMLLEGIAADPP